MKLTESVLRNIVKQEVSKLVKEQEQQNNFGPNFTQAVKQMASFYDEAKENPSIGMDLANVEREFINKFKSSDQVDPAAYVIAAAKAWFSLFASDVDKKNK